MTIPTQNEFLLPFLTLLKDGETLTRSQMMFRLDEALRHQRRRRAGHMRYVGLSRARHHAVVIGVLPSE